LNLDFAFEYFVGKKSSASIEEAKRNIRQAVEHHLASLLAHSQPIPQNERLVHVEELTVGIPE
jgi:predicted RNase H-like HicB family nuclease